MAFDIQGARQAGASDDQIAQYLAQSQPKFDVQGALKAGATLEQISGEIENPSQQSSALDVGKQLTAKALQNSPMELLGNVAPALAQKGANVVGEKTATNLAEQGANPNLAAAAGTAVQMTPDIMASIGIPTEGIANAVKSPLNGIKAMMDASENLNAADKAAGIVSRAPKTAKMASELGLGKGENAWSDVINTVNDKLNNGEQIPLQTAKDFLLKGGGMLDSGKAAEDGTKVALSQAMANIRKFLNTEVPGRAEPAAAFKSLQALKTAAKTASGVGLLGGAALGSKNLISFALRKLAGG